MHHLLNRHIPVVNALDTIFWVGEFRETLGLFHFSVTHT